MTVSEYVACNVEGRGKLNKDVAFRIKSLSAERISIKTDAPLGLKSTVDLDIYLDAGIVEINIKAGGSVLNRIDGGYEIILTDISDEDRNEINELMKNTCGIE